jgi:predicted HTH domain antitoxin
MSQQVSAEYVSEIIIALENQRNQALKQAAEAQAAANIAAKQLNAILKVIKERNLEKYFADEDKPAE